MEFIKNNARGIVIALLAIGVITAVSVSGDNTNEEANQPETAEVSENNDSSEETANNEENVQSQDEVTAEGTRPNREVQEVDEAYVVTVAEGDNQTVLVRDIIARFSDAKDIELSAEQRLFAETNLVNLLPRSDVVYVGDTLRLSLSDVESVFEDAQNLSAAQISAWAAYL